MKILKLKRIVCTLMCCVMLGMLFQVTNVPAAEGDKKELNVVYYNQADYPGEKIGKSTIKAAGCGPTCIAVCYSSLTGKKVSVPKMCKIAYKKGWYINGQGCVHQVIPGLAQEYGLDCKGLGTDYHAIKRALKNGHPVVALVGPGDFTKNGHFIVLTRMVGKDKVRVADVGSRANTAETWSLKKVVSQGKEGADAGGPFWEISYTKPQPKRQEKGIDHGLLKIYHKVDLEKQIENR
ncbi:C39 family peptidase [Anaerostipes faecis]|uniref:C39 family peptidase n=1 Tax=Anaerostipes faecis TaxID=2880702 RepID=UPI0026583C3D|nr:C39 family peptidase [Anaerostipes faecis]